MDSSASIPSAHDPAQGLSGLRNALLELHKTLVDSERITYEGTMGPIESPNHFFQLMTTDPWFAWMRPISQLIVEIDERLDARVAPTTAEVAAYVNRTRLLLVASETDNRFGQHYFEALQRDPDVVLAHARAARHFRPKRDDVKNRPE